MHELLDCARQSGPRKWLLNEFEHGGRHRLAGESDNWGGRECCFNAFAKVNPSPSGILGAGSRVGFLKSTHEKLQRWTAAHGNPQQVALRCRLKPGKFWEHFPAM